MLGLLGRVGPAGLACVELSGFMFASFFLACARWRRPARCLAPGCWGMPPGGVVGFPPLALAWLGFQPGLLEFRASAVVRALAGSAGGGVGLVLGVDGGCAWVSRPW